MKRRVVAIGTFDGVHRGHQEVIGKVKELAGKMGAEPAVVTFDCHPLEAIRPEDAPRRIMPPTEQLDLMQKALGVEIIMVAFTKATASLSAREWMERMRDEYGVAGIVMGYDNVFGHDGTALDLADYKRIGEDLGIRVEKAAEVKGVSSSAVRRLISEGEIRKGEELLGHPFKIVGRVVHGDGIGTTMGYPTANVEYYRTQLLPRYGVYTVELEVMKTGQTHQGIANVGIRPTIGGDIAPRLEVFLPGFKGDLYGCKVKVTFRDFIRPEIKFSSTAQLQEQISKDLEKI